ncbi:AraC family transcriptional regulator [Agaribacter marinus]|uniref:AraC family transcriptional regulator n=1 Tax=Agaribacter marinus TaxID=1431249 RepID=A0AA37WHV5_9ALTE|nr:helix-turn-helix transcriptional regulator [Agaribacter marinus]GLR70368.1 AraC family transcriptional regulator [Agaribacter marinus]
MKHSHEWAQFVYAHKGVLAVSTPSFRFIVPPEQGVWITPTTVHEVEAITDLKLTSFYIASSLLKDLPDNCCVLQVSMFLKSLIIEADKISQDFEWKGTDGRLLRLILDRLHGAPTEKLQLPYPRDRRLKGLIKAMQVNPSSNITLKQWGQSCGASSRTLTRLFKRDTGLTFIEWKQRLSIQIAISQLSIGVSVANVSLNLGYQSTSSFIYMFRQNTGVTPSFYYCS